MSIQPAHAATVFPWGVEDLPSAPEQKTSIQRFMRHVICDGRYIEVVGLEPRKVAEALGLDLSPDDEKQLKEQTLRERMGEVYGGVMPAMGIMILIGIVIVIGIVIWKYSSKARSGDQNVVQDLSPHAALKL